VQSTAQPGGGKSGQSSAVHDHLLLLKVETLQRHISGVFEQMHHGHADIGGSSSLVVEQLPDDFRLRAGRTANRLTSKTARWQCSAQITAKCTSRVKVVRTGDQQIRDVGVNIRQILSPW
jgi:hypothetical protein